LTTPIAAPALGLLSGPLPVGSLASPLAVTVTTGRNQLPRGFRQTILAKVIDEVELKFNGVRATGGQPQLDRHDDAAGHDGLADCAVGVGGARAAHCAHVAGGSAGRGRHGRTPAKVTKHAPTGAASSLG